MILKTFILFFFTFHVYSSESNLIDSFSKNNLWKSIIYYKSSLLFKTESEIESSSFFLSPTGKVEPKSELIATINALKNKSIPFNDQHPICRFRGRLELLRQNNLIKDDELPEVHCKSFLEFTKNNTISSISLIFATGYSGNPASFFGHPLIKLNFKDTNFYLNKSVNYGALLTNNVNPIIYLIKGAFGGFHAAYSSADFFYANHNYTENELRDLWNYQLKLSKKQIDLMVGHIWEMLGVKFPYIFTHNNCATKIAHLLELVTNQSILPKLTPYSIPHTIFEKIHSQGIVKDITLIPSRQTRMSNFFNNLSRQDKSITIRIIKSNDLSSLLEISNNSRVQILDTLIEYYSFVELNDKKTSSNMRNKVLIERAKFKSSKNSVPNTNDKNSPDKWNKPVLTRLSAVSSNSKKGIALKWRPAYFDFLSYGKKLTEAGKISIFDIESSYIDKTLSLDTLELFGIDNLGVSKTSLPMDYSLTWNLSFGQKSDLLGCRDCKTIGFSSGIGHSINIYDISVLYLTANSRLHIKNDDHQFGYLFSNIGIIFNLPNIGRLNTNFERRVNNVGKYSTFFQIETRILQNPNFDLRFEYRKINRKQLKVSSSIYF